MITQTENKLTAKDFLESKPLTLSKDIYDGYKITFSYLCAILEEYAELKSKPDGKLDELENWILEQKNLCPHNPSGKHTFEVLAMCMEKILSLKQQTK